MRIVHNHVLRTWFWRVGILWLLMVGRRLLALLVLHTGLDTVRNMDGELNEVFQTDGIIVGSEIQLQLGFQTLSVGGEEQALIPPSSGCQSVKTKSIICY